MTNLAALVVRLWVSFYTTGFEASMRQRVRQEIKADIWEEINSQDAARHSVRTAMTIISRCIMGIPTDIQRMIEESSPGGLSIEIKKVLGVLAQRRAWFTLLEVSGFILSMLFLGIGTFILAGVLLYLWPGSRRIQQALDRL